MTPVFADAHFWVALLNPRDQWYERAVAVVAELKRPILTTRFVFLEVVAAFARTSTRVWYGDLLDRLTVDSNTTVLPLSDDDMTAGEVLYRDRPDKDWSLTDCISFRVMEARGLREAQTNDHHFEQAGFVALLK